MTHFQTHRPSLDDILNGTPLTPAEKQLLAACKTNGIVNLSDDVPKEVNPENSIRGDLICFLLTGGDHSFPPHREGVRIGGATITGRLKLRSCQSALNLVLLNCRILFRPDFTDCTLRKLVLSGSSVPGMLGERMHVHNDVFLHDDFHSSGRISLNGADIGGQLSFNGACLESKYGVSLQAHSLKVMRNLYLGDGFLAAGVVDLNGVQLGGSLYCTEGGFKAGIILEDATIGSNLFLRAVREVTDELNLRNTSAKILVDDPEIWNEPDVILLDGFTYDGVGANLPSFDRLQVLENHASQFDADVFYAQPHTHLARHYQKNGERQAAARVLYDRERRQAAAEWARAHGTLDGSWREAFRCQGADFVQMFRWIFQAFAGFGHKPMRASYWTLGTVAFSMLYFHLTYINGQMVPNSDIILNSQTWLRVVASEVSNPAEVWGRTFPGGDYETFSAIGYGFDLFVPLDALGQELAWAPSYSRGWWGSFGHYLRWPIQIMGWVLTAIGAALLTGLIGRDRE
ncbi:hypothetical protein [Thalassobius sp. I31.1]|uniref:hypothetical protein n=1 Tax=Thalassobius sp. I31.1 TaxID=2109912 RepID=UPI0013002676|nr:hypothetical protein [Thalassobius sp. I31.1]